MVRRHQSAIPDYPILGFYENSLFRGTLRRENDNLTSSNSQDTCSLLVKNYKKIRDKKCDLILELAGGKTLSAHKAILMGKLLIIIHPPFLIIDQFSSPAHSSKLAKFLSTSSPIILELPEFTHEIMEKVVSFLYSGRLDGTAEEVPALLKVAEKLKIVVLRNYLLKPDVRTEINIQNFLPYYVAAKEEKFKEVKTEALKFFAG
jgi:hypothetical protein